MERKYKQRGYQDQQNEQKPRPSQNSLKSDVRAPSMPAFREITRCSQCGTPIKIELGGITVGATCPNCNADLRTCKNCINFDPGARFQCRKPVTERIVRKDERNDCDLFEPRKTVERQTTSAASESRDPRSAFDKLFKK